MHKVKKAIIPAAGLGTRFLPATKTVPKEMLTIVDAPIIFYVVEEAIRAGIEDIVLIQGRGKTAIEDFFDTSYELEDKLQKDGKIHLFERLVKIREMANIISIRQKQPLGLGHAVLCGEKVVGKDPFAVLLGDEIMVSRSGEPTTTEILANHFKTTQSSTVAVMQ
ncbi:MAG: UTP--glucose-1-phosphate uridylyltransferase, partial [Pseudobdellovibrionaceae bacterium]